MTACPGTETTEVRITEAVVVAGSADTTEFSLRVAGRGFGLYGGTYDINTGRGTGARNLEVELVVGPTRRMVLARSVIIESPRALLAEIVLAAPLAPGAYGVALWSGGTLIAEKSAALEVGAPDAGGPRDADTTDTGPEPDGGVIEDSGADAGLDAGFPDSGLGPFLVDAPYRRQILPPATGLWPAGATIVIPIDHAALVAAAKSRPEGEDLRVYQGDTPLQFQFADRFATESSELELIAKLARDVPAGGDPSSPLMVYYGHLQQQTAGTTDATFAFVERFTDFVSPFDPADDEDSWYEANEWLFCFYDRPGTDILPTSGSYCVADLEGSTLWRQTLSTPRLEGIRRDPPDRPANTRYETQLWLAGRMVDGAADILYLSHFLNNRDFADTADFPTATARYAGDLPPVTLTFLESGANRTVTGWRLPSDQNLTALEWWRVRVSFEPAYDFPSLHLRYVSTAPEGTIDSSVTIVDDWWVRLAIEPDPQIRLGPEEAR